MVRYIGPRVRIVRRLGLLPGLTRKNPKRRPVTTPGQHGKFLFKKKKRPNLRDDYKERLIEKQKIRYNYGITENQLISYYKKAKKEKGSTGTVLLELLEGRLDCIIYRIGFAATIPAARQLINHKHILINNKVVNIPSFICCKGDVISVKSTPKSETLIKTHFEFQQLKRKLILQRMKEVNLAKSRFHSLLPPHLEITDETKLLGKVLAFVKRKNVLVKVKELKVVEYYSR